MINDKLDILIDKICRFMTTNTKKQIKGLIKKNNYDEISKLISADAALLKLKPDETRQDFITSKIFNYLTDEGLIHDDFRIVDIGGGNGNVLSGLYKSIKESNKDNFICVETLTDWNETYAFDNRDLTYKFWDNDMIDIEDRSVDVVMCMVSLHHMNDDTLQHVFTNIRRILRKNGILMIKEHDCSSKEVLELILWEHHLYHMLDCAYKNERINTEEYLATSINNFKSKLDWHTLLSEYNMTLVDRKNRFLEGNYVSNKDRKNVTELYWDIYRKD